jgi:hypothetical protein
MFKKILLAIAAAVVVLIVVVAAQPSSYRVFRTTSIAVPPADVYALVDDFHNWETWSPWAKLDPDIKTTYAGPPAGTGAVYSWVGNDKVGEGRMTILGTTPGALVRIKLEFIKPFAQSSITEFAFSGAGNATTVTWSMAGENNFIEKGMCLAMGGIDKMIGPDFERGLAQMKAAAETAAKR